MENRFWGILGVTPGSRWAGVVDGVVKNQIEDGMLKEQILEG